MDKSQITHLDEYVYEEIFVHNVYHLTLDELKNKGVLDIGGHYGYFALLCSTGSAKQIVSVEPNHNNLRKYLDNTKNTNAKAICAAVYSEKNKILTIEDTGGTSRIGHTGTQMVASITLDKLVEQLDPNLDLLLKVDVEGAEYDIFYNTDPNLIKRFKIIVMEAHNSFSNIPLVTGENIANKLKEYIIGLGYGLAGEGKFWSSDFDEKKLGMAPAYSYKFVRL